MLPRFQSSEGREIVVEDWKRLETFSFSIFFSLFFFEEGGSRLGTKQVKVAKPSCGFYTSSSAGFNKTSDFLHSFDACKPKEGREVGPRYRALFTFSA